MKQATLCFVRKDGHVLLGMKKRGFGVGKWNGFGGKVEEGEAVDVAARRELFEESGIRAELIKQGELSFQFKEKPEWNQIVHVFVAKSWSGEPKESDEMIPAWMPEKELPFDKMWVDDKHWLPHVLAGKFVNGAFVFEGEALVDHAVVIQDKITPAK